jgi:glycosyltransferase involved in cell wall biosynthesis
MKKGFSIIICCYNSENKINATFDFLSRLNRIDETGLEIIIIDNNSTDNTFDLALKFAASSVFETKVLSEIRIGKSFALERAFSSAQYEYLVICDDDNCLQQDYLEVAFGILESNPRVGIIGGQGILNTDAEPPAWFLSLQNCYAVGKQNGVSGDITEVGGIVWGAGMVLRKSVWLDICQNGFCGYLTGRKSESVLMAGEDSEFCILAKHLGYRIYFEERLKYYHNIPASRLDWEFLKQLWVGFSRSQVYFDLYEGIFNFRISGDETKLNWRYHFKNNVAFLFCGCNHLNWYKTAYIAFIEDRPGYLPGLYKRKYLHRIIELLRIFFSYNYYIRQISNFAK